MNDLINEVNKILEDMIEPGYDLTAVLKDLQVGGCISGFVSALLSYNDTEAFYNKYELYIESILDDWEVNRSNLGGGDNCFSLMIYKNAASWYVFEHIAFGGELN